MESLEPVWLLALRNSSPFPECDSHADRSYSSKASFFRESSSVENFLVEGEGAASYFGLELVNGDTVDLGKGGVGWWQQ